MNKGVLAMAVLTALALTGCAGFRMEVYSSGSPTPYNIEVPKEEVIVGGPSFSVGYGAVFTGGTGSVHGWGTGPKGFPERVHERIR